ncbi:MAG: HNH endonuclease signature motif containing protein [Pseudobdellovibrionaceae bacterium]
MRRFSKAVGIGLLISSIFAGQLAFAFTTPEYDKTPGVLCSTSNPDFKGFDYPEQIARCNRAVDLQKKQVIAADYGNIPRSEWSNYEFDHLIPLCAGGSNDIGNLWPQPIDQAKEKDVLENDICIAMKNGTLKQEEAVQKVYDWFKEQAQAHANNN